MQLNGSRGQALIETALMLPIVILLLFGIIYFANFGVVNQRVQIAIRYGGLVGFSGNAGLFSAGNIYQAGVGAPAVNCPPPPVGVLSDSAPFPGPSSVPFFNPSTATAPVPQCSVTALNFKGGAQFLAADYLANAFESMSASSDVPNYLNGIFGSLTTVTQSETWTHPAWPAVILACTGPSSYQNLETAQAVEETLANETNAGDPASGTIDTSGNYIGSYIFAAGAAVFPGPCPTPAP